MIQLEEKGIRLTRPELFLDAWRIVEFSFVSHGHSDHLRNHHKILCTPATGAFYRYFHKTRRRKAELLTPEYGAPVDIPGGRVRLLPAGHILGSAMILVEIDGTRILYTGDFKLTPSRTAESIVVPEADILVMESTYGHPSYRFRDQREELPQRLGGWVLATQRAGQVPIVAAYALGKAQEAIAILQELGFRVRVQPRIGEIAEIYRRFGVALGPTPILAEDFDRAQEVLIVSPAYYSRHAEALPQPHRTLFLSGWTAASDARFPFRWDDGLPLSDHADFDELLEFVARVNPKKVFTLHGFPEFARFLSREGGYDATFLAI